MENNNQVLKIKGYHRGYIQKFWGVQWRRQPIVCSGRWGAFPEGVTFRLNLGDMLDKGDNTRAWKSEEILG